METRLRVYTSIVVDQSDNTCFVYWKLADILRFGGSAQSHLIYHPNSFFPRSAMVNVTVDVLGASINVLEAAARFEGFEVLIEQMFGDDGYYPDDRIMKMFNLKPHEERDNEEINVKKLRGKRSASIHEDINKVEKHLNKLHRYVSPGKNLGIFSRYKNGYLGFAKCRLCYKTVTKQLTFN